MLKKRVIPTLLWKDISLVKGIAFDSWRRIGSIMPAIKVYNTRDVDELILLDITATLENRDPDYDSLLEYSAECFVPLTVGGGLKTLDQVRRLLRSGADKVAVNSATYSDPAFISEAAKRFGSQCIVASIDVKRHSDGTHECFSQCGTQPTGKEPVNWSKELERLGAGEILLTSVDRDGTMEGYDLKLVHKVSEAVSIPVIASGGAGNPQHMLEALDQGASAVAAASIFHFTEQTPANMKQYLGEKGQPVRNINACQK
jgi:imidazole glycerol-phosphate synthase subunit HisF